MSNVFWDVNAVAAVKDFYQWANKKFRAGASVNPDVFFAEMKKSAEEAQWTHEFKNSRPKSLKIICDSPDANGQISVLVNSNNGPVYTNVSPSEIRLVKPLKMEPKYPYIGVNSQFGAIAIFFGKDRGLLLSSGSSWVEELATVKENGFVRKEYVNLTHKSSIADRELLFLRAVGFDTKNGFWEEDVVPYKNRHSFMYKYLMSFVPEKS